MNMYLNSSFLGQIVVLAGQRFEALDAALRHHDTATQMIRFAVQLVRLCLRVIGLTANFPRIFGRLFGVLLLRLFGVAFCLLGIATGTV